MIGSGTGYIAATAVAVVAAASSSRPLYYFSQNILQCLLIAPIPPGIITPVLAIIFAFVAACSRYHVRTDLRRPAVSSPQSRSSPESDVVVRIFAVPKDSSQGLISHHIALDIGALHILSVLDTLQPAGRQERIAQRPLLAQVGALVALACAEVEADLSPLHGRERDL